MSDDALTVALADPDPEAFRRYVEARIVDAFRNHSAVLAEHREYEVWEDKVINGDPAAHDAPKGIIRV